MFAKRHCCKNCHFLRKTIDHDSPLGHWYQSVSWNQEERNSSYPLLNETDYPASIHSVECHNGYWSYRNDDIQSNFKLHKKKLRNIIYKRRKNMCSYVEYVKGINMNRAEEMAQREIANSQIRANVAASIRSWIAICISIAAAVTSILASLGLIGSPPPG